MASLLVQAYPAVPDALAVASAVIADMNEKGQPLPSGLANLQGQGLAGAHHIHTLAIRVQGFQAHHPHNFHAVRVMLCILSLAHMCV